VNVVAIDKSRGPWWPYLVLWLGFLLYLARTVFFERRSGVQETTTGIQCRDGPTRSEFEWAQISRVRYAQIGFREAVVVDLVDGKRGIVRGARRDMAWRHGHTSDFAELLAERASASGVTIDTGEPAAAL